MTELEDWEEMGRDVPHAEYEACRRNAASRLLTVQVADAGGFPR